MVTPPALCSSADLVRRALRDFEGMLIGYVANLTGGDIEMARDVVQDTLIKLHAQDPAKLDGPGLKAWLFTVCRNRALDLLRRNRRMVSWEDSAMEDLPDATPLPDTQAADADETALVLSFLRRLAPNQAEVLRLKFQNDLSYQEIADITGLSATNVGFLIHTGLKKLRILLAPEAAACA